MSKAVYKIIFFLNIIVAFLLLLSYAIPHISSKTLPELSVLAFVVPILILANLLFVLFWIIVKTKYITLSLLILILGYNQFSSTYKFKSVNKAKTVSDFSVMSFNVRLFNVYNWIADSTVANQIVTFVEKENPDILCFQEFYAAKTQAFLQYPHQYMEYKNEQNKTGLAIFSKYPISNRGSLKFPNTPNNAIFADVVKDDDTIRIYNLHLESFHIDPKNEEISQENSQRLLKRIANASITQQEQVAIFKAHTEKNPYSKLVCGDFNNTPYSNIYKQIKGDMKDTFEEAGKGFGKTLVFDYFPMRIDFILADEEFMIQEHKNYSQILSDHFPIYARVAYQKPL